jgi:hypothetical protein
MVNRLIDTGRKYGMEINIDKSQVMRVSRGNESLQIKVNNRELKVPWKCANNRWLLHKGNQDENCHCQRSIKQKNVTLDKQAKH